MFGDIKRMIRSHKLKKDRQLNLPKEKEDKKTNNDLQNIAQKTIPTNIRG